MAVKSIAAVSLLCLSGCATVERAAEPVHDFVVAHPAVVAVGVALAMGGLEISQNHHTHRAPAPVPNDCVIVVQTLLGPMPEPCH